MGLKDKNNPLGQRVPSDKVGSKNSNLEHNQSAEMVEQIKERAKKGKNDNAGREPTNTPLPLQHKIPLSKDATAYNEDDSSTKTSD